MKKILGIVVLGLLLSGNAFAKSQLLETKKHGAFHISTFCIDGYKFVTIHDFRADHQTDSYGNALALATAVNIKQLFENVEGKSLPQKC